jgi:hypothetical protein
MTAELEEDTLASMLEGLPAAPKLEVAAAPVERTVSSTLIDFASGALLALLARGCCKEDRLLLLLLLLAVDDDVVLLFSSGMEGFEEEEGRERV